MLYLDRLFGSQEYLIAIHRRLKRHALFTQLAHRRQRKYLETARVGQYRSVPVHEFVQATVLANDLRARPQHQVKRVAEDDVGTRF